jgi:hypothetical protein
MSQAVTMATGNNRREEVTTTEESITTVTAESVAMITDASSTQHNKRQKTHTASPQYKDALRLGMCNSLILLTSQVAYATHDRNPGGRQDFINDNRKQITERGASMIRRK